MKKFTIALLLCILVPAVSHAGRMYIPAESAVYPSDSTVSCTSTKVDSAGTTSGTALMTARCIQADSTHEQNIFFKINIPSDAPTTLASWSADLGWSKVGGNSSAVCWKISILDRAVGTDIDTVLTGSWISAAVSDSGANDTILNVAAFPTSSWVGSVTSDAMAYVRVSRSFSCTDSESGAVDFLYLTLKY